MGHQIMDFLIPAFDIVVVALNFINYRADLGRGDFRL